MIGSLAFWGAVIGLIGFNAWWLARDLRPAPDLRKLDVLIRSQRPAEAEEGLRELVRRSPNDGAAWMMLGRSLAAQGELVESAEALEAVPFWWPSRGEALFLAGEAYNQSGLARRAEAAWAACAKNDPLHPTPELYYLTAVESLIEIYATQERWDEARAIAWSCLGRVAPDQRINVVFMLLRTRVQRVAPEARIAKLRRFVEADPGDIESRLALARAEAAVGDTVAAGQQIDAALEQEPENVKGWRDRLAILNQGGDMKAFGEAVAKLPEATKEDGEIWKFRGLAARGAGDLAGAVACFEKAVGLRPFDEQAYYQLALALRHVGRREEAEKRLARYKEIGDARGRILAAYEAFSYAHSADPPDREEIGEAAGELAAICRVLGWPKLADAVVAASPGG